MNLNSLKQKALAVAIIGAFAQPALANDECNAGDGLNSWSAWCGIDTYLSQQEPTAAGPIQGAGFSGLNNRSLNTDEFGGNLNENESTETYNWTGYALLSKQIDDTKTIQVTDSNQPNQLENPYELATVGIVSDYENKTIKVVITREDGSQMVLDQGGFFAKNKKQTKFKPEQFFNVSTADGQYEIKVSKSKRVPKSWINQHVTLGQVNEFINRQKTTPAQAFTSEQRRDPNIGGFVAGKPTDASFIAGLTAKKAYYGGYGVYQVSGLNQPQVIANRIKVNFTAGSWDGKWKSNGMTAQASGGFIDGNKITGTVTSAKIYGTDISNLSGTVTGQFSGTKAQHLIGQANVTGNFNGIQGSAKGIFMNRKGYKPSEFKKNVAR